MWSAQPQFTCSSCVTYADNPYNCNRCWVFVLMPQVPALFASSFTKFKAMAPPEGHSQLYWMDWWLRCVPLPEHMHVSDTAAVEVARLYRWH
jgi:hypothetical protein